MLIGLTGLAGSGKSVVANILVNEFGFERVRFSAGLKSMVRQMLRDMGHIPEEVERHIEGDLKEVVMPELGVTPRHLMVTLGTEWGRDAVHPDLWANLWAARVDCMPAGAHIVAEDVRFPNEVEVIRARGGSLWRVERHGLVASDHVSERLDVPADFTLKNEGRVEDLEALVRKYRHEFHLPCA